LGLCILVCVVKYVVKYITKTKVEYMSFYAFAIKTDLKFKILQLFEY